ncbi:MAG: phosphodiester glycosidase family protein [bacterium]|nr:phosphodiester glycosidase family protein [Candidatus Sumerlaeota bacterium]
MIKRTRAMGGVGADYWGADGIPMGLTVIEGDIIIAPKYRTAFAVGKDGVPQIGKWTDGWTWQASVTAPDGTSFPITMMNSECRDNRLCLYTDKYGLPTKGNLNMPASRLSQLRRPVMRSDDSYHPYSESPLTELFLDRTLKASQINTDLQGQSIPRGGTVLAGRGEASNWLRDKFRSGGRARIDLNTKPPWQNLAFAVGGGPQILKDGMNYQDPLEPFPLGEDFPVDWKRLNYLNRKARTAIGVNMNKSTLILVIAELNPPDSIGVYPRQMANVLADFGAWDGMEFNSGPGATLVIDRNVINPVPSNIPNDNTPLVSNALLIYKRQ